MPLRRSRLIYALLFAVTIALGLASRHFAALLPPWLSKNAGDVLYATMCFWLGGFLRPTLPSRSVFAIAVCFCFLIELSQCYQAPWINAIRHTRLGVLVLGSGFHATDLLCYVLGAGIGFVLERVGLRSKAARRY